MQKYFSLLLFLSISLASCKRDVKEGEQLAKQYCATCHMLPSPSLLPQNVWKYSTLPYMGIMLGVSHEIDQLEKPLSDYAIMRPTSQLIPDDDWEKIKEYYLSESPKDMKTSAQAVLPEENSLFAIEDLSIAKPNATIPNFTAVRIDAAKHQIIAGDQSNRVVWVLDASGKRKQQLDNQDALTYVEPWKGQYLFTFIGTTTQANPDVNGSVKSYASGVLSTTIKGLNRPIELKASDLDGDGQDELISSEFGFMQGGMSVWKKSGKSWIKKILNPQTGATHVDVRDINGDGQLDIVALFAQGDERIMLYTNKGGLNFEETRLLRFPSIYGTSSFDMGDVDGDGDLDIVCTAGDNADFSTILKPYHGVYVYTNQGKMNFKQQAFYPQNGATKAMLADLDADGDLDMLSIALFPDVANRPGEGLIYFKNSGKSFEPLTIPVNHLGRWSVMDIADLDGDGDLDVVLGSHAVAKFPAGGFDPAWKTAKGILILRNKKR
ncbi:MAG: FG-GAP-like repeat-containing protein [Bacteroidota bacterium]